MEIIIITPRKDKLVGQRGEESVLRNGAYYNELGFETGVQNIEYAIPVSLQGMRERERGLA